MIILSQMTDMLDRTACARAIIIIGVRFGVFRDVTLLHCLSGFRPLQESCGISFRGLLENEGDMNMDRLISRQIRWTPLIPQHKEPPNIYDKLGRVYVPIFRKSQLSRS